MLGLEKVRKKSGEGLGSLDVYIQNCIGTLHLSQRPYHAHARNQWWCVFCWNAFCFQQISKNSYFEPKSTTRPFTNLDVVETSFNDLMSLISNPGLKTATSCSYHKSSSKNTYHWRFHWSQLQWPNGFRVHCKGCFLCYEIVSSLKQTSRSCCQVRIWLLLFQNLKALIFPAGAVQNLSHPSVPNLCDFVTTRTFRHVVEIDDGVIFIRVMSWSKTKIQVFLDAWVRSSFKYVFLGIRHSCALDMFLNGWSDSVYCHHVQHPFALLPDTRFLLLCNWFVVKHYEAWQLAPPHSSLRSFCKLRFS